MCKQLGAVDVCKTHNYFQRRTFKPTSSNEIAFIVRCSWDWLKRMTSRQSFGRVNKSFKFRGANQFRVQFKILVLEKFKNTKTSKKTFPLHDRSKWRCVPFNVRHNFVFFFVTCLKMMMTDEWKNEKAGWSNRHQKVDGKHVESHVGHVGLHQVAHCITNGVVSHAKPKTKAAGKRKKKKKKIITCFDRRSSSCSKFLFISTDLSLL